VWAVVLPIGTKLWIKLRFMRGLSPRMPPRASIDTDGEHLKVEGRERMTVEGDGQLPPTPSVVPDYDRTTMRTSVAPAIEPFAAGLLGMLPPADSLLPRIAERRIPEPPPSTRGPTVIRVEVPSFSPAAASLNPRRDPSQPASDGQLSAMARLAQAGGSSEPEPEPDSERDERGHVSSVMPTAADCKCVSAEVETPAPVHRPPVSLVPDSDGPQITVAALTSMPAAAHDSPIPGPPLVTPAPLLIPLSPPPVLSEPAPVVQKVLTMAPNSVIPKPVEISSAPAEEQSGVYVSELNAPGVLREVCSPVVFNRCS
jgi:hypothetical protein